MDNGELEDEGAYKSMDGSDVPKTNKFMLMKEKIADKTSEIVVTGVKKATEKVDKVKHDVKEFKNKAIERIDALPGFKHDGKLGVSLPLPGFKRKSLTGLFKENLIFDIDDIESLDDPLRSATEALRPKHEHIDLDENIAEVKFTMILVEAPTRIKIKAKILSKVCLVTLNETEFSLIVKNQKLLSLNYTQIQKWLVNKEASTFTFCFQKSKADGPQHVTVKTNNEKDNEVLQTLENSLQRHIAFLIVHKGKAPNIEAALEMFKSKLVSAQQAEMSKKGIKSPKAEGEPASSEGGEAVGDMKKKEEFIIRKS